MSTVDIPYYDGDENRCSLFDYYITNSFEICNNCFSRIYLTHEVYDQTELRQSLRGVITNDIERTNSAMTDYNPADPPANCRKTICGECGGDRRIILKRPVKKETSEEYAQNLTERVEEIEGLSLDEEDSLIEEILRLKINGDHDRHSNYLYAIAFYNTVEVDKNACL